MRGLRDFRYDESGNQSEHNEDTEVGREERKRCRDKIPRQRKQKRYPSRPVFGIQLAPFSREMQHHVQHKNNREHDEVGFKFAAHFTISNTCFHCWRHAQRRLRWSQRDARQWFSLFGGELFVTLAIYADESGTHHRMGSLPQSEVAVVGGYVGREDSWVTFKRDWEAILRKFDSVPCFHYTQLQFACRQAERPGTWPPGQRGNPYQGWPKQKCEDFLRECARVAASGGRFPAIGYFDTRLWAEQAPNQQREYPYEEIVRWFYGAALDTIRIEWPKLHGPIAFCFDQTQDPKWRTAIMNAHCSHKNINARIAPMTFGDKRDACCYGLQAADLIVGRIRQLSRGVLQYDKISEDSLSELDQILFSKYGARTYKELLRFCKLPRRLRHSLHQLDGVSLQLRLDTCRPQTDTSSEHRPR